MLRGGQKPPSGKEAYHVKETFWYHKRCIAGDRGCKIKPGKDTKHTSTAIYIEDPAAICRESSTVRFKTASLEASKDITRR